MQTRTEHVESLLTDGVFDIPEYQRSYSWGDRQLGELLDDIRYLPKDRTHFFGNIILKQKDERYTTASGRRLDAYNVVDGQQRLTTALILLDVARQLDPDVETSLQESHAVRVPNDRPRLLPQDQDQEFFRDGVLGESSLTADTPSQTRLAQASEYLRDKLEMLQSDTEVSRLTNRLLYDFEINVVEVGDDSEAASIFESINDRGKPLSSLEKTKSFLMYMDDRAAVDRSLRNEINDRFGGIYRELFVLEEGHDRVHDFDEDSLQQFHWGLYDGYDSDEYFNSLDTLKQRLYETYRDGDHDRVDEIIDDYTASLRESSIAFASLFHPESWDSKRVRKRLFRLLTLGRVANVLPVLMAAQLEFGTDEPDRMAKIVEKCETLVFRVYAIDGRRSDTGRSRLVSLANNIYSDPEYGYEDTITRLDEITRIYTDDARFERDLRESGLYKSVSSRDIRYLLYFYGQHLEAEAEEFVIKDLEQILSTEFQVEHILAQALQEDDIPENLEGVFEDHVHRLGNLTIAGRYWNSTYGDLPFADKKRVPEDGDREKAYANSSLKVQRDLADFSKFDRETIEQREEDIVSFAIEHWSVESSAGGIENIDAVTEAVQSLATDRESVDAGELNLNETEFYVLGAVLSEPGRALRSVHRTAASFDEAPIEWTEEWGDERTTVQQALWSLREMDLVNLQKRSWYPDDRLT